MEPGLEITQQIEDAIENASVHVAIFSSTYAQSEWCLNELLLMEKSQGTIISVFYSAEPADLRHGAYLDYLKGKQRYSPETLQNWIDALNRAANHSGFVLSECNGDEVELLEKVAQAVVKMVRKTPFLVAVHPTGLSGKFKDFERTLLSQQKETREARVVGIWGTGGVGKTTLAQEIYNRKRLDYTGASFLFDVREKAAVNSLHILQHKLVKELRHRNVEINSWAQGIVILQDYLANYRALIILDDVDHPDQLDAFLPIKRVLDPRSLILVTSRNRNVFEPENIAPIHRLTGLNGSDSKALFCLHAFSQPSPKPKFDTLVDRYLTVCNGLPLSMKVVGRLLCGQNISFWENKLKTLHDLPQKIEHCLQISYESLSDSERKILLDIACFSIGKDKDTWIRIWNELEGGGETGFQSLIDKCLVDVDGENKIRMHDHVRDLGRRISSKLQPHRLWRATIEDVLKHQSADVRGIMMAPSSSRGDISEVLFNRNLWSELRLFAGEGDFVNTILTRVQLPNLVWLSWNECPCSSLPPCIPTKGLKVLEVTGRKLGRLWQSDSQVPLGLQELNINAPLSEFPKSLRQLTELEKIVVECSVDEETYLVTLPENLPYPCSLKYLKLNGFSKLQTIPKSLGKLTNLRQINLSGCEKLEGLPESLGSLTNLLHIDLFGCESLVKLPESLRNLSDLQHINLSKCESLARLPKFLGQLTNLQRIELSGCKSLEWLPDSFVDLAALQYMDLSQCEFLGGLPNSFGNLINIQHIDMSGCKNLQGVPHSWVNLTNLQYINLSGCGHLETLQGCLGNLSNLHHINLSECERLKELQPQIFNPNLTDIQDISFNGCKKLELLPESIGNLTNLRHIDLSECASLESLPDSFVKLTNLQHIAFQGGSRLEKIPDSFGRLTKLQHMDFRGCFSLKMLPDSFGDLTNLQHLDLQGCSGLKKLPDSFGSLTNLKHVNLSSCGNLTMLPTSFGNLQQLKHLDLTDCCTLIISSEQLKTVAKLYLGRNSKQLLSDVVCLSKLELLHLEGPLLKGLPPRLDRLTSLKKLFLVECRELQCLPSAVGLLIHLNELEIRDCGIQNLPQTLLQLNNLELLDVRNCPLRHLPFNRVEGEREAIVSIDRQSASSDESMLNLKMLFLESIEISEVSFSQGVCPNLEHLKIKTCKHITEVGALPTTLKNLDLGGCAALREIGGILFVENLQSLDMRGCCKIKLDELPLPVLEALESSVNVLGCPPDTHGWQDEDLRGPEILTLILRARRRWCSSCTEGLLPFLKRREMVEIL